MFCWLCVLVLDLWMVVVRFRKLVFDVFVLLKWLWKSYGDVYGVGVCVGDVCGGDVWVLVG